MSNPRLSVDIGANLAELRAGLQQATTITAASTTQMSNSVGQLDRTFSILNSTNFTFGQNFRNQANILNSSIRPTTQALNRAGSTLTDFGRIAQDAPFGFIAIQNNLNPLLESFGRLRSETGSNSAAFRTLGQSLIGPAGIGIALSLVTAGITYYIQWQQRSNKATNDAKKGADDYIETLDQLSQAQVKGAQNAQKEITELRTLYGITQNTTLSISKRKDAVDELQSKYPSYFKNLSDETILNGNAKKAYDLLSESIIATARARAAQDLITVNSKARLINEQKIADLQTQQIKNNEKAAKASGGGYNPYGGASPGVGTALKAQNENLKIENLINDLKTKNNKLDQDSLKLTESINKEIVKGADLTGKVGGETKEKVDKIAEIYKKLAAELKSNPLVFGATQGDIADDNIKSYQSAIEALVANGYEPASKAVQDLINKQNELIATFRKGQGSISGSPIVADTGGARVGVTRGVTVPDLSPVINANTQALASLRDDFNLTDAEITKFVSNYGMNFSEILKVTQDFNKGISDVLNNGAISAISGIGEAIGNSLANGTSIIEAVGKGLLSSFGDILVQLGQVAIQTGVGIAAIKTALKSLNPVVAIAAGVGLIALGTLIKGKVSNIGGGKNQDGQNSGRSNVRQFASGVNNFSGGMALVGERGPELVNLPTGSSVVNNTKTMDMLGQAKGDVNISLQGGMAISASQLYMFVKKGEKEVLRSGYNG